MKREEYQNLKVYFTKENCPFCAKDLKETHEILFETSFWIIVFNKFPYFDENWVNLLVFPKRHLEFTSFLSLEEFADFLNIEKFIKKFYEEKNLEYFSFIRQSKSNKSVEHLHYHYLPWKLSAKKIDWNKFLKIKD